MNFEITDSQVNEIHSKGRCFNKGIPEEVQKKVLMRLFQIKCAYTGTDITKSFPLDFNGSGIRLKGAWRLMVENKKHYWVIGKIFKEEIK